MSSRHPEEPPVKKAREEERPQEEEQQQEEETPQEEQQQEEEERPQEEEEQQEEKPQEEEQSCTDQKEHETAEKSPDVSTQPSSQNVGHLRRPSDPLSLPVVTLLFCEPQEVTELREDTSTNQKGQEEGQQPQPDLKPGVASLPLPPYDANNPIGQLLVPQE